MQAVIAAILTGLTLSSSSSSLSTTICSSSSSSLSSSSSSFTSGFDDVASKTLLSDIVFVGSLSPSFQAGRQGISRTRHPSRLVFTAIFNVERVYKGQIGGAVNDGGQPMRVVVGAMSVSTTECKGLEQLSESTRYLVFTNGSSSLPEEDASAYGEGVGRTTSESGASAGTMLVHWAVGRPEVWKLADSKIVEKLSCATCKGTSTVCAAVGSYCCSFGRLYGAAEKVMKRSV